MTDRTRKKLIYLVTEDWFFCSHFIERAVAAQQTGYDVVVMTHVNSHEQSIKDRGLRVIPFDLDRGSTSPFQEIKTIVQIVRTYQREKPDIVHHVALKPVLYGSLAAFLCGIKAIVNAPVGMGYIFISSSWKARLLRLPVRVWLKAFLNPKGSRVIFENGDDLHTLVDNEYVRGNDATLIKGAGIDVSIFRPAPEAEGVPVVLLTARMLWDKGVGEFVDAARRLKMLGKKARFMMAGSPDPMNRASINETLLHQWNKEGVVEWLGHRTDIPALLAASHIVCLPSYREGLPKSLLEALACGKPVVTTDVHGCREVVAHNVNGLLVPARDSTALAQALGDLIENPSLRIAMGKAGRSRAENEFCQERIIAETLAVYDELVAETASHSA